MRTLLLLSLVSAVSYSNPYWDPSKVKKDLPYHTKCSEWPSVDLKTLQARGHEVVRVDVSVENEKFNFEKASLEPSGTDALLKRATTVNPLGSFRGVLVDPISNTPVYFDSLGTGTEFRLLTRALTFRFPKVTNTVRFDLYAENSKTGVNERVLSETISPLKLERAEGPAPLEIKLIKKATATPSLRVNVYAEGYTGTDPKAFYTAAQRISDTLVNSKFPGVDKFEIHAVFATSKVILGHATHLGLPVPERDSYLGLYFPYWNPFGRWYNVVYPTREQRYRNAIGQVPYDYPIAAIDDGAYWGVGNFNELTAIPTRHSSFTYLLLHEFGHFFGLNEEYEGGGKTELAFAPQITEPWSQNITFHPKKDELKWGKFVTNTTSLPTPNHEWIGNGPFGAYEGGYADTEPLGKSHKPGFNCTMESGTKFCPICTHAINEKIRFDTGG